MNLDWRRLKAVVFESDDWGLCAWVPDEAAFQALRDQPAWRTRAGRIYGRTTLEGADDVDRLAETLRAFTGGDGLPPVWQANTVMAAPDFDRIAQPGPDRDDLPLVFYPQFPSRWRRPGLMDAVRRASDAGLWWPELHGLTHLPRGAWLQALRRADRDALRACEHHSMVCAAVEVSGEFDASEAADLRRQGLALAIERFRACFGRPPASLCAPDYRWDRQLEEDAEALGLTIIQGAAEQLGHPFPQLRRLLLHFRWPETCGRRFYPPPRIAFEPRGQRDPDGRLGARTVHRAARRAWGRGQPAILSTHRANYAHLDPPWAALGRDALRELLSLLAGDGAVFLTDAELRSLHEQDWCLRPVGDHGAVYRSFREGGEPVRLPLPAGVVGVTCRPEGAVRFRVEGAEAVADAKPCACTLEWSRA